MCRGYRGEETTHNFFLLCLNLIQDIFHANKLITINKVKLVKRCTFINICIFKQNIIIILKTKIKPKMKKLLTALPFCFLLNACTKTETITVTETIDLKKGLIAYYPFNGNANDTSGNNKNGVLVNGTSFSTNVKNKENSAANFDGLNDYILITDQTNYFAPPKMSVSFQFNLRDVNARSSILTKSAFTTPSAVSWGTGLPFAGDPHFTYTVADGSNPCSGLWGTASKGKASAPGNGRRGCKS